MKPYVYVSIGYITGLAMTSPVCSVTCKTLFFVLMCIVYIKSRNKIVIDRQN